MNITSQPASAGGSRRRATAALLVVLMATLPGLVGLAPVSARATEDDQSASAEQEGGTRPFATFSGHGWGHGRGMGQWGAQGYALDGQSAAQILDHFYGGTRAGVLSEAVSPIQPAVAADAVRVEIKGQRSNSLRANVASGTIELWDPAGGELLATADEGQTVRLQVHAGGLRLRLGASCGDLPEEYTDFELTAIELRPVSEDSGVDGLLRLCKPDGSSTWFEGFLRAHNVNGQTRTVNVVPLESYLRGVVPNEVPAGWEPAALEAQAVAARSYAAAGDTRQQPYADTCDTILCQVYNGRFRQTSGDGFVSATHPATDAAIAATAGLIRIHDDSDVIARTEFSASTGGYTAGGTFPPVIDEGDDTPANPRHDWERNIDLGPLENSAGLGLLSEIVITERNGFGEDGGRVDTVAFVFEFGTIEMTGNEARRELGLYSDWFSAGPVDRLFGDTNAVRYIEAMYSLFLGRPPTSVEKVTWVREVEAGNLTGLTDGLALSDEWAGVVVDDLYQSALGRPSDEAGREFWRQQIATGTRVEQIGALFYGSAEYVERSGGTNETFVAALYDDLLERSSDEDGQAYWVSELDAERLDPVDVTVGFYSSIESRRKRVVGLYQRVLGRSPDQAGLSYWADQLKTTDDVRLASLLAASLESYERTNE